LWIVSDENIIKTVEEYLSDKKIFIANGYHKYETACECRQEIKEKDENYFPVKEYSYVLAYLCPMGDPGISTYPVYRVVKALADLANLESRIEKYFDVYPGNDFYRLPKKRISPVMIFKYGRCRILTIKKSGFFKGLCPGRANSKEIWW
jgi:uncharacterized protein (DUF1015 family)